MIKLVYENINTETKYSYAVYKYYNKYYVQIRDEDGKLIYNNEFPNEEAACTFVRRETAKTTTK